MPAPAARTNAATSAVMSMKLSPGVGTVSVAVAVVNSPAAREIGDRCGIAICAAVGFVLDNAIWNAF